MVLPVAVGVLKFIAAKGIMAAIKKYGKKAIMQIAKNHGLVKQVKKATVKQTRKGPTAKEMAKMNLIREKEKAAKALRIFQSKLGKTTKKTVKPKGKPKGFVIQNFRGKPKPYY
tara:strand:+ start:189 stop:530 length:342 start_codon:yes stop_codon:yes gene_type:complete